MSLDGVVEFVNLPSKHEDFKVVQLFRGQKPILICGPITKNHSYILETYLTANSLGFNRVPSKNNDKILVPELVGTGYKVVGAGLAEIQPDILFFQLPYGRSLDFNLERDYEFNQLIKKTLLASGKDWSF